MYAMEELFITSQLHVALDIERWHILTTSIKVWSHFVLISGSGLSVALTAI